MSIRRPKKRCSLPFEPSLASLLGLMLLIVAGAAEAQSVVTYHNNTLRTGWNKYETVLTPSNVAPLSQGNPAGGTFGLLHQVFLDEQVDAQPLLAVDAMTVNGSMRNVVYVVTENNTVYALAAVNGAVLKQRNLGPPVPMSVLPGQCNNNSAVVGINSTPVVDRATSTLYVMAYTYMNNTTPTWTLHALDLATLADKVAPAVVGAFAPLTNSPPPYAFNAAVSRQRAALLEANGNIYAGFASFCDIDAGAQRGFVLGWQTGTLAPLPGNHINDQLAQSATNWFLSDIWMSGSGIATNGNGKPLFFVTGNSDPTGNSYNSKTNLSESVVKLSPDLTTVDGFFTPSDANDGVKVLDIYDADFGSGGVLLLPSQPGTETGLAVAAGKVGLMYLLNQSTLGGHGAGGVNHVLGTYPIGGCWCAQSYFTGSDGAGRVVSSGGSQIMVWKVATSPQPTLTTESTSPALPQTGQDYGFFTSVSSNGTQDPIVWAVGRPASAPPGNDAVTLYAYDPVAGAAANGATVWLFSGQAGTWPNLGGNANIVPMVANGEVYVASYKELDIFGIGSTATAGPRAAVRLASPAPPAPLPLPAGSHEIYGTIETIGDGTISLARRTGTRIAVAVRGAVDADRSVDLKIGKTVRVIGAYNGAQVLRAASIVKAKPSPKTWPADR